MSEIGSKEPSLEELLQLKAMYELTTQVANKCFETCVTRINPRLEESEKACLSNCATNFLHMKVLFTKRIIESAKNLQITPEE